jgi:NADH pyrophosphatase NudC (nudix superfamily)
MGKREQTERWQELSGQVGAEMAAWRAEHPRASWREIEAALDERWRAGRAQLLKEAAEASAAADLKEAARCGECGGALRERSYAVCPACGTGHFPPG